MNTNILNFTKDELTSFLIESGEPKYRAGQIFSWLHRGVDFQDMSDISKKTRDTLSEKCYIDLPVIAEKHISADDGTIKYLFELRDGEHIETVFMTYKHGNSLCLSSQAGCRMGCKFCASTLNGLSRNLQPSEMLGQIIAVQKDTGERISNLVIMGIGEPLDNYDNVIRFLKIVNEEGGLNIGYRHISLSTCGIVDKINRLADEDMPITLSISLHAVTDDQRSAIMPINNKWCIEELLQACAAYFKRTGRRISFEYALILGVNDSIYHAKKLAEILKSALPGIPFHVNLIPVNEVAERPFKRGTPTSVNDFANRLSYSHVNATVRRKLGSDINASCGQLRKSKS
jgi:23S rRNA m2A2503 methyltransferase